MDGTQDIKLSIVLVGCLLLLFGCSPVDNTYYATATLKEGLIVTMSVTPLFSLQSDWERRIKIRDGHSVITQELFPDTGWWRGSNLYRHKSGAYVIHEGQIGCIVFTKKPLAFKIARSFSCERQQAKTVQEQNLKLHGKRPKSMCYKDMTYLGSFIETPSNTLKIIFVGYERHIENYLPDSL